MTFFANFFRLPFFPATLSGFQTLTGSRENLPFVYFNRKYLHNDKKCRLGYSNCYKRKIVFQQYFLNHCRKLFFFIFF
ncbi:MAG: hypothetical protein CSA05_02335 [Bacteroidia bacterium]|nr:MAG: hypothetical protein CSA05_02335 [Bacteroidia bacterium]